MVYANGVEISWKNIKNERYLAILPASTHSCPKTNPNKNSEVENKKIKDNKPSNESLNRVFKYNSLQKKIASA